MPISCVVFELAIWLLRSVHPNGPSTKFTHHWAVNKTMVYWFSQGVWQYTWFIKWTNIRVHIFWGMSSFQTCPQLFSDALAWRMLTSTWSGTAMRCSKETWKSMRRWFPTGQARLIRPYPCLSVKSLGILWEYLGYVRKKLKLDGTCRCQPRKLIELFVLKIEPATLIHLLAVQLIVVTCCSPCPAKFCCGPGLDFRLIFAESALLGRCWCWILMGIYLGCVAQV